jgi:tRNA 2-thiouridine synthesizing protein A
MNEDSLDLSGLKCPLPALMARKALDRLPPGFVLTVTATDPLAPVDIPHMCGEEGHMVETITRREGYTCFRIRRGPRRAAK